MPVDKFELLRYIGEQDHILDATQDVLDWISYKPKLEIPEAIEKELLHLVDIVIEPIEQLVNIIIETGKYFKSFSEKQRHTVKDIIQQLHQHEHEAETIEKSLKYKIFNSGIESSVNIFYLIGLVEKIGAIADHAEHTGDIMHAIVSK